jgi:hypothetical protein
MLLISIIMQMLSHKISATILKIASPGYAIANIDKMTQSAPIPTCRSLNEAGAFLVIISSPNAISIIVLIYFNMKLRSLDRFGIFSLGNFVLRPNYTMPLLAYTTIVPNNGKVADDIS